MAYSVVPPGISPKRILVVDDAPLVAETIQTMLSQCGHQVETSTDGQEALSKVKSGKYDLVITDYNMPRMNGLELAHSIKQRTAGQLVLLLTAYAFSIAARYTPPLPVDLVLEKPVSLRELREALGGLFPTSLENAPA
jgi:CheY-like chemotaxis protein